jgi:hypothetical protein
MTCLKFTQNIRLKFLSETQKQGLGLQKWDWQYILSEVLLKY